jgi:hypothetical protein
MEKRQNAIASFRVGVLEPIGKAFLDAFDIPSIFTYPHADRAFAVIFQLF